MYNFEREALELLKPVLIWSLYDADSEASFQEETKKHYARC